VLQSVEEKIREQARRLGFVLAGITSAGPPEHLGVYRHWLEEGNHGTMAYLESGSAIQRRADPRRIMEDCQSILVLGLPYSNPQSSARQDTAQSGEPYGRVAAYAWGDDYHDVLRPRLQSMVAFISELVGHEVKGLWYTDTGPILERELAQRAGLGWIGKNTCLISPRRGSYFLLAEILLNEPLTADPPFVSDHCGSCTRCIEACPTECILPNRTIDARRCISYLTIELRDEVPEALRPLIGDWVFGCDVCQTVCPWNRFATETGDPSLAAAVDDASVRLEDGLNLSAHAFSKMYGKRAVRRAHHRGYRRNAAVALGNTGEERQVPVLDAAAQDADRQVADHARWAANRIRGRIDARKESPSRNQ
jgi:epoxyqueuosine reductase